MIPERYGIYIADLNPSVGSETNRLRPVVVISQNEMNKYLNTVVVCPLTSKIHPRWRSRLRIICMGKKAEIAVDQIRAISKKRLKKKIDQISANSAAQLRRLVTEMYGE